MPAVRRPKIVEKTVRFEDDLEIHVSFDRNRLTLSWADQAAEVTDSNSELMAELIAHLVVSWDVTDEAGTPLPITKEAIHENFDAYDLSELAVQLQNAAMPSRAEGNDSSEPRSTPALASTEPPENSQNGRDTEESPLNSESLSPT